MIAANVDPDGYQRIVHWRPFGELALFGHALDLHYLVNDVFMVFFFGIAAKEITEACLPGGDLNPPAKAMNPLIATIGGVVGPVAVFFAGLELLFALGVYERGIDDWAALARGWGVPTATDIALAWLAARAVFGRGHPAINFLLLLAVVDDGIGLAIIALFYGDPRAPRAARFLAPRAARDGARVRAAAARRAELDALRRARRAARLARAHARAAAPGARARRSSCRSCPARAATPGCSSTPRSITRRCTSSSTSSSASSTSACSGSRSRRRA